MIFFTSDQHFQHKKILELCKNRPFKTVDEMNEKLVEYHNDTVLKTDTVYHIGDFCMSDRLTGLKFLSRLKGHHHLILGNHDYPYEHRDRVKWAKIYSDAGFDSIHRVAELTDVRIKGWTKPIRLQHFPLLEAGIQDHIDSEVRFAHDRLPDNGSLHLSGHTHSINKIACKNNIHIGCDAWSFRPVSIVDIVNLHNQQDW
jgi:calcineurin-like phosphoesterase family protein